MTFGNSKEPLMRIVPLAAVLTLAAVVSAHAAPPPVEDMSNPIHHPYQQFADSGTCQYAGDCAIVFLATTAASTLIQHVSCEFYLASGGTVSKTTLSGPGGNDRNMFPAFAYAAQQGGTPYGLNADAYLFLAKGEQPRVDVFSNGAPVQYLDCTISGYTR